MPLQRVASLRRRAQANVPAASYWLRRVLDDGKRQDLTSPSCKGRSCAMHRRLVQLVVFSRMGGTV